MNYFTEEFMTKQRLHFLNSLSKAQANVGTPLNPSWVDGEILKAEIDENGMVVFQVAFIELVPMLVTVSQIRIFDTDGDIASLVDKEISTARGQGVYETLKVNLFQNEVEVV